MKAEFIYGVFADFVAFRVRVKNWLNASIGNKSNFRGLFQHSRITSYQETNFSSLCSAVKSIRNLENHATLTSKSANEFIQGSPTLCPVLVFSRANVVIRCHLPLSWSNCKWQKSWHFRTLESSSETALATVEAKTKEALKARLGVHSTKSWCYVCQRGFQFANTFQVSVFEQPHWGWVNYAIRRSLQIRAERVEEIARARGTNKWKTWPWLHLPIDFYITVLWAVLTAPFCTTRILRLHYFRGHHWGHGLDIPVLTGKNYLLLPHYWVHAS